MTIRTKTLTLTIKATGRARRLTELEDKVSDMLSYWDDPAWTDDPVKAEIIESKTEPTKKQEV